MERSEKNFCSNKENTKKKRKVEKNHLNMIRVARERERKKKIKILFFVFVFTKLFSHPSIHTYTHTHLPKFCISFLLFRHFFFFKDSFLLFEIWHLVIFIFFFGSFFHIFVISVDSVHNIYGGTRMWKQKLKIKFRIYWWNIFFFV